MSTLREEISRRRTFAIISHPDAGKTTLTEKFLLYGGAIAQAGAVKGKKNARAAVSDWMEKLYSAFPAMKSHMHPITETVIQSQSNAVFRMTPENSMTVRISH